jgi:hypothetical protein
MHNQHKEMADITKCKGDGCHVKGTCYRFTAMAGMRQSFFVQSPIKDGECEMYWGEAAKATYDQFKEILNTNEK